jgi:hypothetical protein
VGGARTASDRLMPACGGIFQAQKSQVSLGARVILSLEDVEDVQD